MNILDNTSLNIKISPEVLITNNRYISYSGGTTYVFSSMTQMLSGGTGGVSLYSGMTIPIFLSQKIEDLGYYSTFDGDVVQKDILNNFVYSASSTDLTYSTICLYNTSDIASNTFLTNQNTTYQIDWGDGSQTNTFNVFAPDSLCHTYTFDGEFQITLQATNIWGIVETKKNIRIPLNIAPISTNQNGTIIFNVLEGSWTATPFSYDFIYDFDSNNLISQQISIPNFIDEPIILSGLTYSRLNDLLRYGPNSIIIGPVFLGNEQVGSVDCNPCFDGSIGYTIGSGDSNISFFDYPNGTTIYSANSAGLISEWLNEDPITKNENLLNISMQPEVQSNIFIERGKNSAYELIQRIGEVDNLGDLEKYGYNLFKVKRY